MLYFCSFLYFLECVCVCLGKSATHKWFKCRQMQLHPKEPRAERTEELSVAVAAEPRME